MTGDEGKKLRAILGSLNAISLDRNRYEPFLDQINEQWQGVAFSVSRLLLLLARQQLQNSMIRRMVDWYADATGLPDDAIEYRARLKPPLAGSRAPEFARSCLSSALSLDPENMYAALLMGMALEDAGDLGAAAAWYEKSAGLRGLIGGVGLWLAARAFEKSGDLEAARRVYAVVEETGGHWRQIDLVHLARRHLQQGRMEDALPLFGQAAEYKWQSLIELFFDLPRESPPTIIEIETPLRCDVVPSVIDPVLRRPCVVYRWYGRYYAVPASIDPVRPIELTGEGLGREGFGGWRKGSLVAFRRMPGLYRLARPFLRRLPVLHGVCRQFERSLTRSSSSLDEMATGHGEPMPAQQVVGFVDADGYEYRLWRHQELYFAVPVFFNDVSWSDIELTTIRSLKLLIARAAARRFPALLKLALLLRPRRFHPLVREILGERILSAATLNELAMRFQFREGTRP